MKHIQIAVVAIFFFGSSLSASGPDYSQPGASLDVTKVSTELRDASSKIVTKLDVEFLGENELVVMSVDDIGSPIWAARDSRPVSALHLTLDFFQLEENRISRVDQLKFETDNSQSRVRALPSGAFVVTAGKNVYAYDSSRYLLARKRVEEICKLDAELPANTLYDIYLYSASEQIAVVNLTTGHFGENIRYPVVGPRPFYYDQSRFCWFSTHDLAPVRQAVSPKSFPNATAWEDSVYMETGGMSFQVSEAGTREVFPTADCALRRKYAVDTRFLYPLRAERGLAYPCNEKEFAIERDGKVERIPTRKAWPVPVILTDAWSAPLLLLDYGSVRVGLGGSITTTSTLELMNYRTKKTYSYPALKTAIPSGVTIMGGSHFSLSPSGRLLAVLKAGILSVYRTPAELVQR